MEKTMTFKKRSWLFTPGDSERKMQKALAGPADIVLLDLEDAVAPENKALARSTVHDFLKTNAGSRERLWVRVNPLSGPYTLDDLVAIMPANPGGIMLPKVSGRSDVDLLDHYLTAFEAAHGHERGATPVIVLATETAQSMYHTGAYQGAPRLAALTWGAEDLADALGANSNQNADGSYGFTYELARSLTLLGAAAAGVSAIDTISADYTNLDALHARTQKVRRDGFEGMMAIHPAQVDIINAAFSPSQDEIDEAREIVALFQANPGAGTIGWRGGMLDRPYLSRAMQLLAQVDED